jgi:hypothetical protein
MNRRTLAGDRRRRKAMTTLWVLGVSVLVIVLIYREMTAVLYILATLGVTALLLVVALSDLTHVDKGSEQLAQSKAAAGIANKIK